MAPPLIWKEVEKMKDGKQLKIRIQQITEEFIEPVIHHMTEFFPTREPITSYLNILNDPVSTADLQELWREFLKEGAGIVAILLNEDGSAPEKPTIIGANVTGTSVQEKNYFEGEGNIFKTIITTLEYVSKESNIYEKYGVDRYLDAYGLTVHSGYHGLGIGLDIIRAREAVCKTLGLALTATAFTAPASQHIAAKDGFHIVKEFIYKDLIINGKKPFENLEGKLLYMAKTYS